MKNIENIIYICFLLIVICLSLIISSNKQYHTRTNRYESYVDMPLGGSGKSLNIDTDNKSISLSDNQEKESSGLESTPITIGPNGYPLRSPGTHSCTAGEGTSDANIIQNKICTPVLKDGSIRIYNTGARSVNYHVFYTNTTPLGYKTLDTITNHWMPRFTNNGKVSVNSNSHKIIQFKLPGVYTFLHENSLYSGSDNSRNFQIYIN